MSDHITRTLREDELRTGADLFRAALHLPRITDENWATARHGLQPGRTFGVFDDELIGLTRSIDVQLAVPGGRSVPLAAVTSVGVRADRTRRGVLTSLMRAQLADCAERGVVAATLHATEGLIYGRFGYGVATVDRTCTVDRRHATLRPEVPQGGRVELLDVDAALARLPEIYARIDRRAGMMSRPGYWWRSFEPHLRGGDERHVTVVHHGTEGADGFAIYRVTRFAGKPGTMHVVDFHAGNPEAFAGLWRFLLGVDLVDEIHAEGRPVDEPVELLFTDPRACRVTAGGDEIWLRLIDVRAALETRERDGASLVVEVDDPVLDANTGRYLVTPDGVSRTDEPAQLRIGVDALAMVYLGAWRPSTLAAVGRAAVAGPEAAHAADTLFRVRSAPWCGTFF